MERRLQTDETEPGMVVAATDRAPSGALQYRLKSASPSPSDITTLFTSLYEAFNARDVDAVLACFASDVDWPNGMEGGRVHGHHAVRDYWTRQWTMVDPRVTPTAIEVDDRGRVIVTVRQVVRDLSGALLRDQSVQHIYELRDGTVIRMDIRET